MDIVTLGVALKGGGGGGTPLTPAQEAAINSGITSEDVAQIDTNTEDIAEIKTYLDQEVDLDITSQVVWNGAYGTSIGSGVHVDFNVPSQLGAVKGFKNFDSTDFIDVEGWDKVIFTFPKYTTSAGGICDGGCAFYDSSKTIPTTAAMCTQIPMATGGRNSVVQLELPIPSGAKYFRTTFYNDTYTEYDHTYSFSIVLHKEGSHKKLPYQSGDIHFTFTTIDNLSNQEATTVDDGHVNTTTTRRGVLRLPSSYTPSGKPSPVIMVCHGWSGYVSNDNCYPIGTDTADIQPFLNSLNNAGYVIFDVDNLDRSTVSSMDMGAPTLIESYRTAFDWIKENYNVEDKLSIYAMSMGCFSGFNFINLYRELVNSALFAGVRTSMEFEAPSLAAFASKFGMGNTYDADLALPWDIYAQVVTIDSTKYLFKDFPPTKFLIGGTDIQTDTSVWANGYEDVAEGLKNTGNYLTCRVVEGYDHTNICHIVGTKLVEECTLWFKKWK